MAEGGLGGVFNGIKWGIILNLAAVVLLPMATHFLGTQAGSGGGRRPFSSYEGWASSEFGRRKRHGSGGQGGMGWGGD